MKKLLRLSLYVMLILCRTGWADTHYVNMEGVQPTAPYTTWITAATRIQDAVNAAESGDTVMVYDGTYETGGALAAGDSLINRVCITKSITVSSLNGPEVTIIRGEGSLGSNAVRGVLLDEGAVLSGFTLTGGATLSEGTDRDCSGGGVLAVAGLVTNCIISGNSAVYGGGICQGDSLNSTVSGNSATYGGGAMSCSMLECELADNSASFGGGVYDADLDGCDLHGNTAENDGGGAYQCEMNECCIGSNEAMVNGGGAAFSSLMRCTLRDNTAAYGGGAYGGAATNSLICNNLAMEGGGCVDTILNNCTITQNEASDEAGGVSGGTLVNSIVFDNYSYASEGHNYYGAAMSYSCTEPALVGPGNISDVPCFADASGGDFRLTINSPCVDTGNDVPVINEYDRDGNVRIQGNAVDMGAYEYSYCHVYASATAYGNIDPQGDLFVRSGGSLSFVMTPRTYGVLEALDVNGEYQEPVEEFVWESITEDGYITACFGVDESVERIHYVWTNSPSPEFPYASWDTAAHVIQDAADAAWDGATVLVTNGVYTTGGARPEGHELTSRVCLTNGIEVRSVNGPGVTMIVGEGPLGSNAVRGAFLMDGTILSGFTVTNGFTLIDEQSAGHDLNGGGVLNFGGTVENCIVAGNRAQDFGGGMYMSDGMAKDCTFDGNMAYDGGGLFGGGMATNCLIINNCAELSGGGAQFTPLIDCVISNNHAVLGGGLDKSPALRCRIVNNTASAEGGGVHSSEDYGTIDTCIISGNTALHGGGQFEAVMNNCVLFSNHAEEFGGASYLGTLTHCTLFGNRSMYYGGGSVEGELRNCIVYFNTAPYHPNRHEGSYTNCCTSADSLGGAGNIAADPQLIGGMHILPSSPCAGAGGSSWTDGADIDGQVWAVPPAIGCDQPITPHAGELTPAIYGAVTTLLTGDTLSLIGIIEGEVASCAWNFGDGTVISNQTMISHVWTNAGTYTITLTGCNDTYPDGVSTSYIVHAYDQPTCYVWTNSPSPAAPYGSWSTAAHTIQAALDVAGSGYLVLVTNGVYEKGGVVLPGMSLTNRICTTHSVTIRSMNGPEVTIIKGHGPIISNAVRCAYLDGGAALIGFTLTNGGTLTNSGEAADLNGGGVLAPDAHLENCIVSGNAALQKGGGMCGGTAQDCSFIGNMASYGGGVSDATLTNCILRENAASTGGGGGESKLINGLVISNTAVTYGGGLDGGSAQNCTISGNTANYGGGVSGGQHVNSVIYGNFATISENAHISTLNYCCVSPDQGGEGNITGDPLFADAEHGDFSLSSISPCLNVGNNNDVMMPVDLRGAPRIQGGWVDLGAYEYRFHAIAVSCSGSGAIEPSGTIYVKTGEDATINILPDAYYHIASVLTNGSEIACVSPLIWSNVLADGTLAVSFAADMATNGTPCWWLAQYGWTNEFDVAALADQDGDGLASWKEYVAGTIPTDALSLLSLSGYAYAGQTVLSWASAAGKQYEILYSTNGLVSWKAVTAQTDIPATPPENTVTNTVPFETDRIYFRIRVR